MKTYSTYQEAQIANPYSDKDEREEGIFSTESLHQEPCDCMTLKRFLADGHKLVDGDSWLDVGGEYVLVDEINLNASNTPHKADNRRYILRAKALEDEMNEEIKIVMTCSDDDGDKLEQENVNEWKNGDECEIEMNGNLGSYVFGCLVHGSPEMAIVFTNNGHMKIPTCRLLKPETPEQKLVREALELFESNLLYGIDDIIETLSSAGMLKNKEI